MWRAWFPPSFWEVGDDEANLNGPRVLTVTHHLGIDPLDYISSSISFIHLGYILHPVWDDCFSSSLFRYFDVRGSYSLFENHFPREAIIFLRKYFNSFFTYTFPPPIIFLSISFLISSRGIRQLRNYCSCQECIPDVASDVTVNCFSTWWRHSDVTYPLLHVLSGFFRFSFSRTLAGSLQAHNGRCIVVRPNMICCLQFWWGTL